MNARACSISVQCYGDKYSDDCPVTGCCDDGKGEARHSPQVCRTIRGYHPERMNAFSLPRLWVQGWWGRHSFLVPRSKILLLSALKGSM